MVWKPGGWHKQAKHTWEGAPHTRGTAVPLLQPAAPTGEFRSQRTRLLVFKDKPKIWILIWNALIFIIGKQSLRELFLNMMQANTASKEYRSGSWMQISSLRLKTEI